mgnify:CR=1 FL=1
MIPLSIPNINGNEWQYVKDCLETGWISSAGEYVNKFEEAIQNYTGVKYAVACMNGTAGLQVSLNLAGVTNNDIVIAPNLTFVASLNAISYSAAEIVLIDVCEDSWQMDIDLLQNWLENINDWNLSRSRFWGIPLPIWRSRDGASTICVGSVEELRDLCEKSVSSGNMKTNPLKGFVTGDMGYSYLFSRPVNELVWERLGYTLLITVSALLFTWARRLWERIERLR